MPLIKVRKVNASHCNLVPKWKKSIHTYCSLPLIPYDNMVSTIMITNHGTVSNNLVGILPSSLDDCNRLQLEAYYLLCEK